MSSIVPLNRTFGSIKEHTKPETIVILDFDDTIIKFDNEFNNLPDWWKTTFEKYLNEFEDCAIADQKTSDEWRMKAMDVDGILHTDEPGLLTLIDETRKAGNLVVILTARDAGMVDITKKHLDKIGLTVDKIKVNASPNAHYDENGVFYTAGKSKGLVILEICEQHGYKNAVFVDDLKSNLEDALDVCEEVINIYTYRADF